MDYFSICDIIKEFRKRAGLSQAALCEGLCELPTMNRIENGKQNPNKKLLDALIQRLQIPLALNIPMTNVENERNEIEAEIDCKIENSQYDIFNLLEKYKSVSSVMNKFELQCYLFYYAVYLRNENKNPKEALKKLNKAIRLTFLNYDDGCNEMSTLF